MGAFVKLFYFVIFLIIINFSSSTVTGEEEEEDCSVRYRRNWYSLTSEEKYLYISGYQKLRRNGVLTTITESYSTLISSHNIYDSSLFLFYSEYLIYEFENAIRSLGNIYKCFSMPYWDYTIDAGNEDNPRILDPLLSGLGSNGDINNNYCIISSNWNICDNNDDDKLCYSTPFEANCNENDSEYCCLKRAISSTQIFPSSAEISYIIFNNLNYYDFAIKIRKYTNYIHAYFGTIDNAPMSNNYATEDPIFWLLYSFNGYLRSLWSDCHQYDLINVNQLDNNHNAYISFKQHITGLYNIDNDNEYGLDFVLNDMYYNLNYEIWSDLYNNNEKEITIRNLYDISSMNIKYDISSFYYRSHINNWCDNNLINNNWFRMESMDPVDDLSVSYASGVDKYINKIWNKRTTIGIDNIYLAMSSLSCNYIRLNSVNSCFNNDNMLIIDNYNNNLCNNMNSEQLLLLSLNDLYDYISDDGNECLLNIRQTYWSFMKNNIILKQQLCNSEYDYKCNVWNINQLQLEELSDGYDDISSIINDESIDTGSIITADINFGTFNTSLWSVIVWCSMFIFLFMICCYMIIVKKDYETELIYKKKLKQAHVTLGIYGAV